MGVNSLPKTYRQRKALKQTSTVPDHCCRSREHLKVFGDTLSVETNLSFKTDQNKKKLTIYKCLIFTRGRHVLDVLDSVSAQRTPCCFIFVF